jgi:hypothetical protein
MRDDSRRSFDSRFRELFGESTLTEGMQLVGVRSSQDSALLLSAVPLHRVDDSSAPRAAIRVPIPVDCRV